MIDEVSELRIAIGRLLESWQRELGELHADLATAPRDTGKALHLDRLLDVCDRFAQRERVRVLTDHVRELKHLITPVARYDDNPLQTALDFVAADRVMHVIVGRRT